MCTHISDNALVTRGLSIGVATCRRKREIAFHYIFLSLPFPRAILAVLRSVGPTSDVNARKLRNGFWRRKGRFGASTGKRARLFFGPRRRAHLPRGAAEATDSL